MNIDPKDPHAPRFLVKPHVPALRQRSFCVGCGQEAPWTTPEIVRKVEEGRSGLDYCAVCGQLKPEHSSSDAQPIVRKGDALRCQNGHILALFRRDMSLGDPLHASDFEPAAGLQFEPQQPLPDCPACGARPATTDGRPYP